MLTDWTHQSSRKQTSHISDVGLGSRVVCTREYNDSITVKGESFYFICLLVLLSFLWTDRSDWGGDCWGCFEERKTKGGHNNTFLEDQEVSTRGGSDNKLISVFLLLHICLHRLMLGACYTSTLQLT